MENYMHHDIYYSANAKRKESIRSKGNFSSGSYKANTFLKKLIEMSVTPGIAENYRVIAQEDLSVSIYYRVRVDAFRKYFLVESPSEISQELTKLSVASIVNMQPDPDEPYISINIDI